MKRYFLLPLAILSFTFIACSGDDSSPNEDSFDPDGIATVNNGGGVDFSQYENVWIPENGSDEGLSGIVNIAWTLYGNENICGKLFITDDNWKRYNLTPPFYVYCINGEEYYAGTFKIFKKNNAYYVTTKINKKGISDGWESVQEVSETHKYFVYNSQLVFFD